MPFPRSSRRIPLFAVMLTATVLAATAILLSCSGGGTSQGMGSAFVTISDPPSCKAPAGDFQHVFISIRSVQAHIDPAAGDTTPGWQELTPLLNSNPMQIDLLNLPSNGCLLAELGSTKSLPAGSYQQIRLLLVSNSPGNNPVPATNNCSAGFNCVVLADGSVREIKLSSQANTGLKIPRGQIAGGPIQVAPGQSVDINIDFNTCASLIQEGNGNFHLKPVLTADQVTTNSTGITGTVVDATTSSHVVGGTTLVALEQTDSSGADHIFMEASPDSSGNFNFCPLPAGATFDVVLVAINGAGVAYNATVVAGVPGGTALGTIPIVPETGASTGPGTIQGFVTALTSSKSGATADVSFEAFQTVTVSGGSRQISIPLEGASTGIVSVNSSTSCPAGSPAGANCAQYTLIVPASNPQVGAFASGTVTFTPPAAGNVLYTVGASAAVPMTGTADCSPSTLTTSQDTMGNPLKVTPGATTNAKQIDFSGCS